MVDTQSETRSRLLSSNRKGSIYGIKLCVSDVRHIRARYKIGNVTYRQLALEYGVSVATIFKLIQRLTWRDVD